MRARGDVRFYECFDCQTATVLLRDTAAACDCPGCGSANGQVVSNAELGRQIEAGAIVHIDLSPSIPAEPELY